MSHVPPVQSPRPEVRRKPTEPLSSIVGPSVLYSHLITSGERSEGRRGKGNNMRIKKSISFVSYILHPRGPRMGPAGDFCK